MRSPKAAGKLRRRNFDHLLMAPLDGAVARPQMDDVAKMVGKDLDLHVTRFGQALFEVDGIVAEGHLGFRTGHPQTVDQLGLGPEPPECHDHRRLQPP